MPFPARVSTGDVFYFMRIHTYNIAPNEYAWEQNTELQSSAAPQFSSSGGLGRVSSFPSSGGQRAITTRPQEVPWGPAEPGGARCSGPSLFISGFASQAPSRQAMDGRLGDKHSYLADKRSPERMGGWP